MSDLSEQISKLANEYDPEREAEAAQVRAFIQGSLAGAAYRLEGLAIEDVEQIIDGEGNYLPYFVIETRAGHRIRVAVEVE